MTKTITSKRQKNKRRRSILQKNQFDISTALINPLVRNLTPKINTINQYYSPFKTSSQDFDFAHFYQKDNDNNSTFEDTFSQSNAFLQNDRDLFCLNSPSNINFNEDELEKMIVSTVLTPTNTTFKDSPLSYGHYTISEEDEDINLYKINSVDEDNKRIGVKGWEFLNEIKETIKKLEDNHISLGYLFRNANQTYAIIDQQTKNLLIDLTASYDIQFLSKLFNISKKSIMRWKRKGTIRKKGAGRKISDPQMENRVIHWYNVNRKKIKMTSRIIKQKAIEFSQVKSFQASKGWFEKFKKKYNLVINNLYKRPYCK